MVRHSAPPTSFLSWSSFGVSRKIPCLFLARTIAAVLRCLSGKHFSSLPDSILKPWWGQHIGFTTVVFQALLTRAQKHWPCCEKLCQVPASPGSEKMITYHDNKTLDPADVARLFD